MSQVHDIMTRPWSPVTGPVASRASLLEELIGSGSGAILAVFMWGHMVFVGSILLGSRGFDWVALTMERYLIAQPTVIIIGLLFLVHAALAARKIPARLAERRRFRAAVRELSRSHQHWQGLPPHLESMLWIWQVRTGAVLLVLGSFHLLLMVLDIFTDLFGLRTGIEAVSSLARTGDGLVWLYAVMLVCVEFHASVGLYRLAVKWGIGRRLGRHVLHRIEQALFWFLLGLGALVLVVLAGWVRPPLAFLLEGTP